MRFPTEKHREANDADLFGFKELAQKIHTEILLEMETPNCVGIFGNWGVGKTSFLNQLLSTIQSDSSTKTEVVFFAPWKYEYSTGANDLLYALMSEVKNYFKIEDENDLWNGLAASVVGASFSIANKLLNGLTLSVIDLDDMLKRSEILAKTLELDKEKWVDHIKEFQNTFSQFITSVLKKSKSEKLVVVIDDLDRCLPENTVRLLEAIKNFLFIENVLFVLALDNRIVSEMIEQKYGLHMGYGQEYLMKIIPYHIDLPVPPLEKVVEDFLLDHGLSLEQREINWIASFCKRFVPETRRLKHLLSSFFIKCKVRSVSLEEETPQIIRYLFLATYLQTTFPKLFKTNLDVIWEYLRNLNAIKKTPQSGSWDVYHANRNQLPITDDEKNILVTVMNNRTSVDGTQEGMDISELKKAFEKIA